jgi:hypothetical protein
MGFSFRKLKAAAAATHFPTFWGGNNFKFIFFFFLFKNKIWNERHEHLGSGAQCITHGILVI